LRLKEKELASQHWEGACRGCMKTSGARPMLHSPFFGTVSNMKGHASCPTCPLVSRAQHLCPSLLTSSIACRSRAFWPPHGLRTHLPITRQLICHNTSAQHCEAHPNSHVCRRAMLAFGVAGLGLVHSAQPADAETAIPTELREQSLLPACLALLGCHAWPVTCTPVHTVARPPVSSLQAKLCKDLSSS
jgi:hypothetical protein